MSKIHKPSNIAGQYATIVYFTAEGEPKVSSFYHGTTAVRTMLDLAVLGREFGIVRQQYLVATDARHRF